MTPITRTVTQYLLLIAVIVFLGWDIFVATNEVSGDTLSEVILAFAQKNPSVSLALGIVLGHLLWPQRVKDA